MLAGAECFAGVNIQQVIAKPKSPLNAYSGRARIWRFQIRAMYQQILSLGCADLASQSLAAASQPLQQAQDRWRTDS